MNATKKDDVVKKFAPVWYILAIVIILVIIGVLLFSVRKAPDTFDSLYNKTLQGHESERNFMYNNFVFVKADVLWETLVVKKGSKELTEYQLSTYFNPRELENISSPVIPPTVIQAKSQWILSYPINLSSSITIAGVEVGKVLGSRYGLFNKSVVQAVSEPYDGAFPVLTCANATKTVGVITFRQSNITAITVEGDCIFISGETDIDVLRAADRFVFTILGIMQ